MILAKTYCGLLLLHGALVLLAPRLAGLGFAFLLWVLVPGLISLVVLALAADRRLIPAGPMVLVAGADVALRCVLALLGSLFWMKTVPLIGSASILLGVLGWVLTQSFKDSEGDEWRRVDQMIMSLRSLPPEPKRRGDTE